MRRTGIIEGITTNPVLIRKYFNKEAISFNEYIPRLLENSKGIQTFIQPVADNADQFISEAHKLLERYGEGRDIVIKVPLRICGRDKEEYYGGLSALIRLSKQ